MRFQTTCSGLVYSDSLHNATEYLQSQAFLHSHADRPAKNVVYLKPEHVPARLSYWKLVGVLPWIDSPNHVPEARKQPFLYVGELGVNAHTLQAVLSYLSDAAWLAPNEPMTCAAWTSPRLG